jgi:hypothetical protein
MMLIKDTKEPVKEDLSNSAMFFVADVSLRETTIESS